MSAGETRLHGCSKKQATAPKSEPNAPSLFDAVVFVPSLDAGEVNLVTRLLLQPRLAAVGHGLVERLEVFERGLVAFLRGRAEVFVEPPVGRAPGVGLLRAQLPGEVFAQERMRIERDERAGRVAVHREQLRGFEAAEAEFPIVVGQPDERFGEAGDGWRFRRAARQPASAGRSNRPMSRSTATSRRPSSPPSLKSHCS